MKNKNGMSLVELMVAVGMFSIFVLAFAEVFFDFSKKLAASASRKTVSDEMQEFTQALEIYLTNATKIYSCACGTDCIFSTVENCTTSGTCTLTKLIEFETEAINDLSTPMGTYCETGATNPRTSTSGSKLVPRGCKKKLKIAHTVPTVATYSAPDWTVGATGTLKIIDSGSGTVLNQLNGVYGVQCGQTAVDPSAATPVPSQNDFIFQIKFKGRANTANVSRDPQPIEGWHPSDPNFYLGFHKMLELHIPLRNLANPGIHYARTLTFPGCKAAGATSPQQNCCSGYYTSANLCIAASACWVAGTAAVDPTDLNLCCSHQISGGVCL